MNLLSLGTLIFKAMFCFEERDYQWINMEKISCRLQHYLPLLGVLCQKQPPVIMSNNEGASDYLFSVFFLFLSFSSKRNYQSVHQGSIHFQIPGSVHRGSSSITHIYRGNCLGVFWIECYYPLMFCLQK